MHCVSILYFVSLLSFFKANFKCSEQIQQRKSSVLKSLGVPALLRPLFKQSLFISSVPESFFAKIKIRFFVLNSMVGADAAAAITITCRGTYAFDTYMSNAGIDWVPKKIQVFETGIQSDALSIFPFSRLLGMVERQITIHIKQKRARVNKKHAFRSPWQQRAAPAPELNDAKLIGEMDMKLNEGKYNDLTDGRYDKTIYVKTWTGRTVSLVTYPDHAVGTLKRQLETKTGIPKNHQYLTSRGKVLDDSGTLKEYGLSGGETVEMTALLLGGMKHKSLSPTPMADRDKRKESEPYIDVSGLEGQKSQEVLEEEAVPTKKWMSDTMKELKERTDDMSEFERTMTNIKLDMKDVKEHMNKVTEALSKISDDNNTRDRRFEELIQSINNGLQDRDMKTDKKD